MESNEIRRYLRAAFQLGDGETAHLTIGEIAEIAAGRTNASGAGRAERHLSKCELCRQQLSDFQQFALDCEAPAPADQHIDEEWRAMRARLRWDAFARNASRFGAIAAGLVLAIGLGWIGYEALIPSSERLLAEAYHDQRTIEFRVARADYSPVRVQRAGSSAFSAPAPLLKAEAQLKGQLQSRPDDPDLLRLEAEAELIAREAGAAVRTLRKAVDFRPQDARILADLGAAYALRGDLEHQPADYPNALEYLSRSIRLQPRAPDVVFNRALVLERMLLKDQAILEWEAYLKMDGSSEWANEARKHLAELKALMKRREEALALIVDDPEKFLALAATGKADAEAFLREIAVTKWLPRTNKDARTREAADRLAQILREKHGDSWLSVVLQGPLEPGADQLAAARVANLAGNPNAGLASAREAERSFSSAGNQAGAMWARFEVVSALVNLLRSDECFSAAGKLISELNAQSYSWLSAQARMSYMTCALRSGRLDAGVIRIREADEIARMAAFGDASLKAGPGLLSAFGLYGGISSELYGTAERFLRQFWDGAYSSIRFQAFIDTLRIVTDQAGQKNAAWFLARSELWAVRNLEDDRIVATIYAVLAASAQAVGEEREAAASLDSADRLYRETSRLYFMAAAPLLANVEIEHGDSHAAIRRLEILRANVSSLPIANRTEFFQVLGEAYRRAGRLTEAADAFRESIHAGELRIASLSGERERSGILQTIEKGDRGLVAIQLKTAPDGVEALRIWRAFHALDRVRGPAEIRASEDPLLTFVELPDEWISWLSLRNQVTVYHIPAAKNLLASTVTRFRRECSDPRGNPAQLRKDAQQLYEWMVEPFAARLAGSGGAIIVELDGALGGVPVPALMSKDGGYLGDRFSVLLSSGYTQTREAHRLNQSASVLLTSNPALAGDAAVRFPPLPDVGREAEAVHANFRNVTVLEGRQATVEALNSALPRASIFHFAGHGYSDSDNGALIFAPKDPKNADYELLRSSDLLHQDWSRCRLAVLSACAAAAGEIEGPHNPDSLVRALTRAGVPRVAASLWIVDSAATSELISAFYNSLAKGRSAAEALRAAQQRVRRHSEWSHPYYWAGFELFGTI